MVYDGVLNCSTHHRAWRKQRPLLATLLCPRKHVIALRIDHSFVARSVFDKKLKKNTHCLYNG